jgi:hypothetical protein
LHRTGLKTEPLLPPSKISASILKAMVPHRVSPCKIFIKNEKHQQIGKLLAIHFGCSAEL